MGKPLLRYGKERQRFKRTSMQQTGRLDKKAKKGYGSLLWWKGLGNVGKVPAEEKMGENLR